MLHTRHIKTAGTHGVYDFPSYGNSVRILYQSKDEQKESTEDDLISADDSMVKILWKNI